jgi:hypothetical protein
MQKRPSKLRDINQIAASVVAAATGEVKESPSPDSTKNPAAVALGRLGGLKGGNARAEKLSKEKRSEIAKLAAAARWKKY